MTTKTNRLPEKEGKTSTEVSAKKQWITPTHEKIEVLIRLPFFFDPNS